jgi:transglutaminase-like putative cysteine protease
VIKPDGRVVPVDVAANSKESIDQSQMDENIYDPDSRVLEVNIPGLEVGDLVHTVTHTLTAQPIIPGEFGDEFMFEARGYVRHISCEIRAPAAKPLTNIELRDEVKGTVTTTTTPGPVGTVIHHWEINAVPRMYDEPNMPPDEMVLQRLVVSTLPDWKAVSQWYWRLSMTHLAAITPDLKQTVDGLTAGAASDPAKVNALFQYVSRNIRYMGVTPEKDRPGYEPHDVKLTFEKKYGVCRDKAALLVAMLGLAGEKAYPVLINVGTRLDPQVPNPFFNHAIVAVESSPGHYTLMDPTDEHTRELLPAYDDNQSFLVCRPEGDTLSLSPVTPPEQNMMHITTTGTLGDDGRLTATAVLDFTGVNDDEYRGALAEMKPDDRRRFFASRLQRIMPGAQLTSLTITPADIMDTATPLHAAMTFAVDGMAAFGGGKSVVNMPWIGRSFGVANYILDGTGLEKRKYPLETQVTCGIEESVSIKLGANFAAAVSTPSSSPLDDDSLVYQRQIQLHDQTLDCSRKLALKVVEFSPAQYLELKQMLRNVAFDERKMPVVATAGPAPDKTAAPATLEKLPPVESNAKVVADDQSVAVTDAHNAVVRIHYLKKVLTYAGKTTEAEVKIPYNPSTEDVKILHAWVTDPAGKRQEVSADETNLMDDKWNSSAKRYTGGKVLVDSLPGVEIGSTIDVELEFSLRNAPFVAGFESFQLADELEKKSLALTAPAGLKVAIRQSGPPGLVTAEEAPTAGSQVFKWQAQQVAAVPEEAGPPPDWSYRAGIAYYVGDPKDYLNDLNAAMQAHAAHGAKAAEVARGLAAKAPTRLAAVQAIRDYVVKAVRVAGPSFTELRLSELSDADTTLADGYGHEADRAILFQAMLAAAGFAPRIELASDLPAIGFFNDILRPEDNAPAVLGLADAMKGKAFPEPDEFRTPLVEVEVDGQAYYLNDTDQYAKLGSTAHDGRLAIVLAGGAYTYHIVKAAPDCRSRVVTTYTLTVADDGNARIGIKHEYYGMKYQENNRHLAELRPEERARFYQETVAAVAQGAKPSGGLTTDFASYPGVEEFAVEVANYGIADGKFLYFSVPATPHLFPTETDRRSLPLLVADDADDTVRTEIKLPANHPHVIIAPASAVLAGPDGTGSARITAAAANGEFDVTYELKRQPAVISPKEYADALKTESALENKAGRVLLLETGAEK